MSSKGRYKKELKQIDKAISFYIEKSNKTKQEISYLHTLLNKRHDLMLQQFYEGKTYEKFIPKNAKVVDILLNKPFFANKYMKSSDDSAPDAFILLEENGKKTVLIHELKCGRSKRMVAKGVSQLDKYVREVSKSFHEIKCMLTYGKRTKVVELNDLHKPDYFGFDNQPNMPEI